jgi:hypothetical protein
METTRAGRRLLALVREMERDVDDISELREQICGGSAFPCASYRTRQANRVYRRTERRIAFAERIGVPAEKLAPWKERLASFDFFDDFDWDGFKEFVRELIAFIMEIMSLFALI